MNIFILGSGNVATHLGKYLHSNKHKISGIYSRNARYAENLGNLVSAPVFSDVAKIPNHADLYLICVSDNAIGEISWQMPIVNGIVAHTAGSVSQDTLNRFPRYGVFYPLQSFSRDREVDLSDVPFCIEANTVEVKKILTELASTLSNRVFEINSEQRLIIHLAAVFANNFANHMFAKAREILAQNKIPFDILKPLLFETVGKAVSLGPHLSQTGPACRGDEQTIARHIALLSDESLKNLYRFVSDSIINEYKTIK